MIDFWNSRYQYYLGSLTYFGKDQNNYKKSIQYFLNALKMNPHHLYSWFSLAKAYWMNNDREEAGRIFDRLAEVNTMNRNVAWDAGVFLLTKGEELRALKHFRRYLILEPAMYENVFSVCIDAGISHEIIAKDMIRRDPALLDLYYAFLIKRNMIDVLEAMLNFDMLNKSKRTLQIRICNNFIANGYLDKARQVWTVLRNREFTGGLKNGGFEDKMIYGCFDWFNYKGKGYRTSIDEKVRHSGMRSIAVSFDGTYNVGGFLFSQIISVETGKSYNISAFMKSENITTSNGVYLDVRGYKCNEMLRSRSEEVTGSGDWRELQAHFQLPEGCETVMVSIRRDKSNKLNNKISGTAWFDDIAMEELN